MERTDGEVTRQEVIERYDIWKTPNESVFADVAELAAQLMNSPFGFFSIISDDEWWVKAGYGVPQMCAPRESSLCNMAVERSEVIVITDAAAHPEICDHPVVTGPVGLRAYVGVPVYAYGGMIIGTLCVYDTQPHTWGPDDIASLKLLARQLEAQLESRRRVRTLERHESPSDKLRPKDIATIAKRQIEINTRVLHDFRNVLAAIRANVDFLDDTKDPDDMIDVIFDVRVACESGLDTVRELEEFANLNRDFADQLVSDTEVEVVAQQP